MTPKICVLEHLFCLSTVPSVFLTPLQTNFGIIALVLSLILSSLLGSSLGTQNVPEPLLYFSALCMSSSPTLAGPAVLNLTLHQAVGIFSYYSVPLSPVACAGQHVRQATALKLPPGLTAGLAHDSALHPMPQLVPL